MSRRMLFSNVHRKYTRLYHCIANIKPIVHFQCETFLCMFLIRKSVLQGDRLLDPRNDVH